jgi:NAD(P)-dependent dehydrogenase (short-subunit alcohol dehydrogenase family)
MDLEGKSVVVTGGARGIGRACARELLERGARVTICATSEESIADATANLNAGDRLATVVADVATVAGCEATVAAARESFASVDALVANAGLYLEAPMETVDEVLWDRVIDTNLKSAFFCVQAALPDLIAARGAVVTISSYHGLNGVAGVSVYGAAKAGVCQMTKALALELAPDVRVNCIAPGYIWTEKLDSLGDADQMDEKFSAETPAGRVGQPREIAEAVTFALENEFVNGTILNVDGGRVAGPFRPGDTASTFLND